MCLSVCLSVTSRHCTKMAKCRIMQIMPDDHPRILVFWCPRSLQNSNGVTPNGGTKERKFSHFISRTATRMWRVLKTADWMPMLAKPMPFGLLLWQLVKSDVDIQNLHSHLMTNALKQVTVLDTRQTVNDKYTQWQWADSTDVVFKDTALRSRTATVAFLLCYTVSPRTYRR